MRLLLGTGLCVALALALVGCSRNPNPPAVTPEFIEVDGRVMPALHSPVAGLAGLYLSDPASHTRMGAPTAPAESATPEAPSDGEAAEGETPDPNAEPTPTPDPSAEPTPTPEPGSDGG